MSLFSGITRNLIIVGLVSLLTDLSSQMVFPLLPLFLTSTLSAPATAVGVIEGAAEATAAFLKMLSGYFSDKIQKRKPFVLLGYLFSNLTKPLFALATSWWGVLFIRVVERIGKGVREAPRDAIVAESTEKRFLGKAFGLQRAMDGIGSMGGALLAFWLLPQFGYSRTFTLALIPGLIAIVALVFIREPQPVAPKPKTQPTLRLSFRVLPRHLKFFILLSAFFTLGHFGYAFLLLKAKTLGISDQSALLLYVLFYAVYTLCSIPLGALSDRIGRKLILKSGYLLFGLVCLGSVYAHNAQILALWFAVYGICFAMLDGSQRAFVVDLAPPELKATALGAFQMAIALAALPGGYLAGLFWDKISPATTFWYGGILALMSFLLLQLFKPAIPAKAGIPSQGLF